MTTITPSQTPPPADMVASIDDTKLNRIPTFNTHIYAIGNVQPSFPSLSVEKEFMQSIPAQVTQVLTTNIKSNKINLKQLTPYFYSVLSDRKNFHIARELTWQFINTDNNPLFSIEPKSIAQINALINATEIDSQTHEQKREVLIGQKLNEKYVSMTHLFSLSANQLNQQISQLGNNINTSQLAPITDQLLSLQANDGEKAKNRAINFVLYNNPAIYIKCYELLYAPSNSAANPNGFELVDVTTREQHYHNGQQIDLIFHFVGINTGAPQAWYCSVDVSGEFPYLLKSCDRFLMFN